MTAPNVEFGNTAQDIGQGATTFVKGLLEERRRQQQLALQAALASAKMMEASQGQPLQRVVTKNPQTGAVEYAFVDPEGRQDTRMTGVAAPDWQMQIPGQDEQGNLTTITTSRGFPGSPAKPVDFPTGQGPRQEAPAIVTAEGPQGPQIGTLPRRGGVFKPVVQAGGGIVQPKGDEGDERRARDAMEMVQGQAEMKAAVQSDPSAYQAAASYLSTLDIADGIPVIGGAIEAIVRNAQGALSPEAARYFNAFMQFAAARAFSRGGATLTRNEIDYALLSLSPKPGEDPVTSQQRERSVKMVIGGAVAGNPAWQRYKEQARALGFDLDEAFGAIQQVSPQAVTPKPRSKYGYSRP